MFIIFKIICKILNLVIPVPCVVSGKKTPPPSSMPTAFIRAFTTQASHLRQVSTAAHLSELPNCLIEDKTRGATRGATRALSLESTL